MVHAFDMGFGGAFRLTVNIPISLNATPVIGGAPGAEAPVGSKSASPLGTGMLKASLFAPK